MHQNDLETLRHKNRKVGQALVLILTGLMAYSFLVIKYRGRLPEPTGLTPFQRILRGL